MPSSEFVTRGAPVIQARNIMDLQGNLGGGSLYEFDLSQPSAPTPRALKTTAGAAFTFPGGTQYVGFRALTRTIAVADGIVVNGKGPGGALVYDRAKGVVVPVSIPNSDFGFLTTSSAAIFQ